MFQKKDKYSRFNRYWYEEPKIPKFEVAKFAITNLYGVSERYNHFPNLENYYENLEDGLYDNPENTGKFPYHQSISLQEINSIVKENSLDEKDVHFTIHFEDDYLILEVLHIKEMSVQEKQEQYKAQCEEWKDQKNLEEQRELEKIKREMEMLQRKSDAIKNKKLSKMI